jgi:predicted HicB family RNase H-like nuclease
MPKTKYSKTLKVRVEAELYEQLKLEAERLDTDISKYVRSCIRQRLDGKKQM